MHYTTPKGKMPRHNITHNIPIRNKYDALSEDDSDMETEQEEDVTTTKDVEKKQTTKTTPNIKQVKKPPPLVIHGEINEHHKFLIKIKDMLKNKFYIKYNKDYTEVYTTCISDYQLLKDQWQNTKVQFHTFTVKENKKRIFVIRGLHAESNVAQMLDELKELGFDATQANLMKNTSRPLFMITFSADTTLTHLKQKVQYLSYTKITWENYVNKKRITQCHRCQEWGHATANCYAEPTCLKCADKHLTRECTKPRNVPAKCANCDGDHPANATICIVYQRRLSTLTSKRNIPNNKMTPKAKIEKPNINDIRQFPKLKAAPAPAMNAWSTTNKNLQNTIPTNKSEITELASEINKINQICNITHMLKLVKELRMKIEQCQTKMEQFQVFTEFSNQLEIEWTD